jgi:hypothetical protein
MSSHSVRAVPSSGSNQGLATAAPSTAPIVFAAPMRPATRAGSRPVPLAAARARGKLAPHRHAAGRMATPQRMSSDQKRIPAAASAA